MIFLRDLPVVVPGMHRGVDVYVVRTRSDADWHYESCRYEEARGYRWRPWMILVREVDDGPAAPRTP